MYLWSIDVTAIRRNRLRLAGVTAVIADLERYDADLLNSAGPIGGGLVALMTAGLAVPATGRIASDRERSR